MRVLIPLFDRFTALDAVGPYEVLSRLPGAQVTFVASAVGPCRTDTGSLAIVADASFEDADTGDILVVPGGPGSRAAATDVSLLEWVRRIAAGSTWTTSVCTGADVLGAAGLLRGLEATTHWSATERLASYGATYSARRVVVQGKVVTAAGVSAGIDMALMLAGLVAGEDIAKAIQLAIEYDPQPPFDSGSLSKASADTVELVRRVIAARKP